MGRGWTWRYGWIARSCAIQVDLYLPAIGVELAVPDKLPYGRGSKVRGAGVRVGKGIVTMGSTVENAEAKHPDDGPGVKYVELMGSLSA